MVAFQFILLASFMIFVWYGLLRNVAPPQRVMGLFGCTHKTVAIGIPLINALYENTSSKNDNNATTTTSLVALYALPLLVWHPLQLVLGTLLAPSLAAYVVQHQQAQAAAVTGRDDQEKENMEAPSPPIIGSSEEEGGTATTTTTTTTAKNVDT
jgi:solute carrier family 10 (sodium/bile acid cotransporter), member 7